jgi:hypothetical protein
VNLNHRSVQDLNLFISNERLVRVSDVKIFGVVFDDWLVFDEQIHNISKKMRQRIGLLSRLWQILPEKALINVYIAILLPILDYSLILWGFTYNSHINRLETLQKKSFKSDVILYIWCQFGSTFQENGNNDYKGKVALQYSHIYISSSELFEFF